MIIRGCSLGFGDIGHYSHKTGILRDISAFKNQVVYSGIDLLGLMLGGRDYKINMMYLEFNNGGALTPDIDPADGRNYYAALEVDGNDNHGYLRIPILGDPTLESSDPTKFTSNKVSFFAMTTGATGIRGALDFSAAATSTVFGIALVSAPDLDDPTQDIVFARSYDFTPKVKQINEEIAIRWAHVFPESISSSSSGTP